MNNNPTPPEILALKRGLYALVGGEQGCPRRRFFISMAVAALLAAPAGAPFLGEFLPQPDTDGFSFPDIHFIDIIFALFTNLSIMFGTLAGGLFSQLAEELYRLLGLNFSFGSAALNIYVCGTLLLLTGVTMFILGCRRLRDAGRSRWHLLAGMSYMLVPSVVGSWLLCVILQNLGGLWLLYLYTRPSSKAAPEGENRES